MVGKKSSRGWAETQAEWVLFFTGDHLSNDLFNNCQVPWGAVGGAKSHQELTSFLVRVSSTSINQAPSMCQAQDWVLEIQPEQRQEPTAAAGPPVRWGRGTRIHHSHSPARRGLGC